MDRHPPHALLRLERLWADSGVTAIVLSLLSNVYVQYAILPSYI